MNQRCHEVEELDHLGRLAPGDPRRGHLDSCARCRARLAASELFHTPASDPPGARIEEARHDLNRFIDREFGPAGRPSGTTARAPWWRGWRLPAFVLAPAAVAVFAAVLSMDSLRGHGSAPVWRGVTETAGLTLRPPLADRGGSVELSWSPLPASDGYQVRIFSADLKPLYQSTVGPDTVLTLQDAETALNRASGSRLLWRVAAYQGSVEVGLSSVRPLIVP